MHAREKPDIEIAPFDDWDHAAMQPRSLDVIPLCLRMWFDELEFAVSPSGSVDGDSE
jgi:hypothetical protein